MKPRIDLLIATSNPGKIGEIRRLLRGAHMRMTWLGALGDGCPPAPAETGRTFAENARLKAIYYATRCGIMTFSEDSGLCVEALAGMPGPLSARFLGAGASYEQRCRHILEILEGRNTSRRNAWFDAAGAVADPAGRIIFEATGRCRGRVADEMAGRSGFGYDPIFYYPPAQKTFAQMTARQKNEVSHRGQLLRKLRQFLLRNSSRSGS